MTDPLMVRAGEVGLYRLFSVDLPKVEVPAFTTSVPGMTGKSTYPLRDALGLADLDETHVQILDLTELETLGIATYLTDGLGIAQAAFKDDLSTLNALEGYLVVIASAAFPQPTELAPQPPLSLVATYGEDTPHKPLIDLKTPSAEGILDAPHSPAPVPGKSWPHWVKLLSACVVLAILYGLFVLVTAGDTP